MEKADSKTISGFFTSIHDQLLKVFVVSGGIKLSEYLGLKLFYSASVSVFKKKAI